jgi:hypothetical protein
MNRTGLPHEIPPTPTDVTTVLSAKAVLIEAQRQLADMHNSFARTAVRPKRH